MRVAFVGKGGAGKSVIAGTFARLLARGGERVLAVDSDPLPGLAFSLGVPTSDAGIPDEAFEEKPEGEEGPRYRLRAGLSAEEAVERYTARAPDGVRFLQFGKPRGHVGALMGSQFAFRQIVRDLPADGWTLVGDLPGGTRQPFFGWAGFARTIVVVAEPTAKGMLSARRLARLAEAEQAPRLVAVASKVTDQADIDRVADRTGLEVVGAVPYDERLAEADRRGAAPLDAAPDSPAIHAVRSLLQRLQEGDP